MDMTFLEKKKNRLTFELLDVDHTFCNALRDELWNDADVAVSTYRIDHPLTGKPRFIVETTKGDAIAALKEASKRLQKKNKDFATAVAKF